MIDYAVPMGLFIVLLLMTPCIVALSLLVGFRIGTGEFKATTRAAVALFVIFCMAVF